MFDDKNFGDDNPTRFKDIDEGFCKCAMYGYAKGRGDEEKARARQGYVKIDDVLEVIKEREAYLRSIVRDASGYSKRNEGVAYFRGARDILGVIRRRIRSLGKGKEAKGDEQD